MEEPTYKTVLVNHASILKYLDFNLEWELNLLLVKLISLQTITQMIWSDKRINIKYAIKETMKCGRETTKLLFFMYLK